MGQYFMAVNLTKREYLHPQRIRTGAKFWEWCVNPGAGVFPYLLRRSTETGGGDLDPTIAPLAGSWAGDQIYLVGGYDASDLYETAKHDFTDVSAAVVAEFNRFVGLKDLQLCP